MIKRKKYIILFILSMVIFLILILCSINNNAYGSDWSWITDPNSPVWKELEEKYKEERRDLNEYYFKFMIDKNNNWDKQEEIKNTDQDREKTIVMPICNHNKLFFKFKGWKLNNDIYAKGQEIPVDTLIIFQ